MEQTQRTKTNRQEPVKHLMPLTAMLKRPKVEIEVTCQCGTKFMAWDLGHFTRSVCDGCVSKFDAAEDLRIQQEAKIKMEKEQRERILQAHIPHDFANKSFDTSDKEIHPAAFSSCKKYATEFKISSPSLIIHSEVFGSGKTHLACLIANYLLHKRHVNVRFAHAFDIIQGIRSTYQRGSKEDEEDVLYRILSPVLLIIDDLGLTTPTDWSAETYWALFDRRKEIGYPVVVTTNYYPSDEELGARIGKGALSRLLGMCGSNIITFKGPDLRRIVTK
jgi:DNA replication protein DnaC